MTHRAELIDGFYHCPFQVCEFKCEKLNSIRTHGRRNHGIKITIRKLLSVEEKQARRREQLRNVATVFRNKIKANTRMIRSTRTRITRARYNQEDAIKYGRYKCKNQFLEYKQSRVPNSGNGIFALRNFVEGDYVTFISGKLSLEPPKDLSYASQTEHGSLEPPKDLNGTRISRRNSNSWIEERIGEFYQPRRQNIAPRSKELRIDRRDNGLQLTSLYPNDQGCESRRRVVFDVW